MKKIITSILALTLISLSLSFAIPIFACSGCADQATVEGMMPEFPTNIAEQQNDTEDAIVEDSNKNGEWTVMIIVIIVLTIMTGGIVYMTTKSWDGKKSDTSNKNKE